MKAIADSLSATSPDPAEQPREDVLVLRKGLEYCWSVAVAALPGEGKPFIEKWFASSNNAIQWIMQENLKKVRLVNMDPNWV